MGQNALACQQFSAQADDETEHGQAAIPGFSEGDETKARLVKEGMTIVVPDAKFQADLKKIGDVLAADWEKRAGPDGVAALKEFRNK